MTEVRSGEHGVGLFATKEYKAGDVISEEAALIRLAPATREEEERLMADWEVSKKKSAEGLPSKNKEEQETTFWDTIDVPSEIATEYHGTFRGLIQAAACYALSERSSETNNRFFELYHPSPKDPSSEEESIVKVAKQALDQLKRNAKDGLLLQKQLKSDHDDDSTLLLKVMLIWACNSFQGGRVYDTISRINHDCDPTAVIQVGANDSQIVRAASTIKAGEEITISYLGTLLYADQSARRQVLLQSKYFTCNCARCLSVNDVAASIPCSFCHPRTAGLRQLDDDVQYDDEQTVHYMSRCRQPSTTPEQHNSNPVYQCDSCLQSIPMKNNDAQCISDKVLAYLRDRQQQQQQQQQPTKRSQNNMTKAGMHDSDDEEDEEDAESQVVLEERLLQGSVAFMGARHWTTNLLLLLNLDQSLQQYHAELLAQGSSAAGNSEPDMEKVAEAVDLLERLYRFVDGLGMKLHAGHLLGDVTIGVARALVGLGDVKSQKYAAEWLDKIADNYVALFESEGIQRVVSTLRVAWTRQETIGDNNKQPAKKRLKTSY